MNAKLRNMNLQREAWEILSHPQTFNEDIDEIRNAFYEGYCEVLRIAFQATIHPAELKKLVHDTGLRNERVNYCFIANSLENPKAYEIINEYLEKFIELCETNNNLAT